MARSAEEAIFQACIDPVGSMLFEQVWKRKSARIPSRIRFLHNQLKKPVLRPAELQLVAGVGIEPTAFRL